MTTKNARIGNPTIDEINPDRKRALRNLAEIQEKNSRKDLVRLLRPGLPYTEVEVERRKYESNPEKYEGFKEIKEIKV